MKVTGTDGEEITVVTTNTGFIISKGLWLLLSVYNLNRQQAVDVLKVCIQLHVDTPDTPNWYIKHHNGLEYLNMAMAQVTENPDIAEGSSIHQDAKQQLHQYIRPIFSLLCKLVNRLLGTTYYFRSTDGNLSWFNRSVLSRFRISCSK